MKQGSEMGASVNIVEIIDQQKISWLQLRIVILGALTLMLDGFDNQMIGFVAPALKSAWHINGGALGPVFSVGVFGVGLGSLLIGPFGDRFGRARVLLFTVLSFAVFSFLHAQATSIKELMVLRFGIGLVLGAVIPLVVVLCNEYAPQRHRAKMVTIMTCGYGVGAAAGGFVSAHVIPEFGWQAMFYLGSILPLILGVVLFFWMPESIRFLALRQDSARIAAILAKINPTLTYAPDTQFYMVGSGHDHGGGTGNTFANLRELFTENRALGTILLWICLFMNLIVLNLMNNWLPTLVLSTGLPTAQALRAATALQFGGVIGIAIIGVLADRFGYYKVLAGIFAMGGIVIGSMSLVGASLFALVGTIFLAGFAVIGAQMNLGALSATLYPTRIRATGSSWAFGVARLLSIVGPLLGGIMVANHWSIEMIFSCVAVPMFFAMLSMLAMMWVKPAEARQEEIRRQRASRAIG
ncbi:MAG TPA: MFS transporter [Stellaceae bacterium]|nr:MFS transporter [Stellaceae bacterium]